MSTDQISHVFAGNPIRSKTPKSTDPISPTSAFQTLKSILLGHTQEPYSPNFKVLPFQKGRPLTGSNGGLVPNWHLGWLNLGDCKGLLVNSEIGLSEDKFVYLGSKPEGEDDDVVYWAIDVSEGSSLVNKFGSRQFCFVDLRTLMVVTDWADSRAMGDLAVAGHGRALLEWYTTSQCDAMKKEGIEIGEEYRPDSWIPYCPVAEEVPKTRMAEAFTVLRDLKLPVNGYATDIGLVEYSPVRELFSFVLGNTVES